MPSTNNLNTNKFKQDVPSPYRTARLFRNVKDAFYCFRDGSFMRVVAVGRHNTMMRRCDDQGRIIPRVRMSKRHRLFIRRFHAALAAEQTA